ncbi:bifunctional alpha/beta hydrolase/OsmC family protein [Aquimarina brevivitae]|uniref:Putative redox protein n=1 Tax=Aquimarina brevivitae TaxID=323412 RepID=A0A4Q7P0Z9_9FLAO|nr:bifunctional alpha/beta hydrolase/OsmC family protein [Aquimarina brevivitae]RZS93375.1 putative redox protein [Aquimarina brevivitae]
MSLTKVTFTNPSNQTLTGRLELPTDQHPHNFAIFAHCFTCTKNLGAVRNISRALTAKGFGVLRFDFTGLGESEGDFADTNFSGNVEDLIAAADFLTEQYAAPTLLIGHSLGGAATIFAAAKIKSIRAIATIGAPSDPDHVTHLLKSSIEEIEQHGKAVVNLSGRDFTIKKQFLEDLKTKSLASTVKVLNKALLILHSPQDTTVGIKNAEDIYTAAKHPKSFVSLDGADHLLTNKEDSIYVGNVIAGWATRYVAIPEASVLKSEHHVVAQLDNADGYTTQMKVGSHHMIADEPTEVGGHNFGPTPYELVSAGLAACTAMTIKMYVSRKGWNLQNVEVHTSYDKKHKEDCDNCENPTAKIDTFEREIELKGNLDDAQKAKILEIADKCPVHKTLHTETQVITKLL